MLLQMPGPSFGLKPPVAGPEGLQVMEADILDLEANGHVRLLPSNSSSVVAKFTLTSAGRAAGSPPSGSVGEVVGDGPPPSDEEVLRWLAELRTSARGAGLLANGGALLEEADRRFREDTVDAVAASLIALGEDELIVFDDASRSIDQISDRQRLVRAGVFRLTATGRDRAEPPAGTPTTVIQIVHAVQAQVAAGSINNYVTFSALLDRAEEALDQVHGVDEETREEARGIIDKLRAASGTIASGASSRRRTSTGTTATYLDATRRGTSRPSTRSTRAITPN